MEMPVRIDVVERQSGGANASNCAAISCAACRRAAGLMASAAP